MRLTRSARSKPYYAVAALGLILAGAAGAETSGQLAGATTTRRVDAAAFSQPSANMAFERQLDFRVGDGIFRKLWVPSPSSTKSSDGLGPLLNARGCQSCHLRDGRGRPPAVGEAATSMVLRLSIPPQTDADHQALATYMRAATPEPTYGGQLQNFSVNGLLAEGRMTIAYTGHPVTLADGEVIRLRKPRYGVAGLNYGPLHRQVMMSPRVAPPMIGLGLLEMIPEEAVLKHADPEDADSDGIAGRPNRVRSHVEGRAMIGRFGWKAGMPTVADQVADAFATDLGLSTHLVRASHGDCTPAQKACLALPVGDDPREKVEVPRKMFDLVVFYARNLAVPPQRNPNDPAVLRGKALFAAAGCSGCHVPSFVTGSDPARPEQSAQRIFPYADLLLHDMGEGLADERPEGEANGRQWRTPPLWGIGLTRTVSGHDMMLHDGRARGALEAILWHGGEAEAARARVQRMSRTERADLLAFIQSL
ncbi:di-heme oxidoredictase family protein [Ferrovibrio sp.]|uniref:di-heme oxidoreductase family protein n=1 Tax=Ferrovibrio sp. TaxID=1917215 RepID=UPI000CBC6762|nr:di-heme oxidoredictase family protein [Ferrovibrio sp.]PJI37822.1 MAG: thiol oxidoreductase [Ferrovibrio sp.]